MKTSCLLLVITLLAACTANNNSFKLTGEVMGIRDSTMLYLDDATSSEKVKTIDSVMVINGRFTISHPLLNNVVQVNLHTHDFSDYKYFWIERGDITFHAVKGGFRDAIVAGSETQKQDDQLAAINKPFSEKWDSLNKLYKSDTSKSTRLKISKQEEELREEELVKNLEFIKSHPASLVSAQTLDVYASSFGKAKTEPLFKAFSDEIKHSSYGKNIATYLKFNKDLKIGDHYANFTQSDPSGKKISVSDFKGKVILIDFWASWCGPCRKENIELVKSYQQYKGKGFEILGVSIDRESEKADWIDAIKKDGLKWANVSEFNGDRNTAALIYGISGIPDNFLINKQGIIVARNLRGQDLRDKLAKLLN